MSAAGENKAVLVTGAAGFIGSHLVRKLLQAGHRVLSFDALTYAGSRASLADCEGHPAHQFHLADVRNAKETLHIVQDFSPDWTFHLAAETHVDRSISDPTVFLETNVLGTGNLLTAATSHFNQLEPSRKAGFRFIQVSTDEVFGSATANQLFSEDSPYQPRSPYAASKAAADHLVRAWENTYGLPIIITCCSNNYGRFQFPEKLIPLTISKILAGEIIPIYGNGQQSRDWIHVDDHCDALIAAASSGISGSSYLIGANNVLRNIDLVKKICDLVVELSPENSAAHSLIRFVTDRPGHDLRYAVDSSKIRAELGWAPKIEFSAGLRDAVLWYLGKL